MDADKSVPSGRPSAKGESGISPPMNDEEPEMQVDADTGEGTGIEDIANRSSLAGEPRTGT